MDCKVDLSRENLDIKKHPKRVPFLFGMLRLSVPVSKMADRTGLEPATSGVTGRHSNQLNYRSAYAFALYKLVGGTGVEPVTYAL